jgi:hypothetical protein
MAAPPWRAPIRRERDGATHGARGSLPVVRRAVVVLLLVLSVVVGAASAAAAEGRTVPPVPTEQTGAGGAASQPPSIVPKPGERGTNNLGGLVVGVVLLGGWVVAGSVVLFRARARRNGHAPAAHLGPLPGAS